MRISYWTALHKIPICCVCNKNVQFSFGSQFSLCEGIAKEGRVVCGPWVGIGVSGSHVEHYSFLSEMGTGNAGKSMWGWWLRGGVHRVRTPAELNTCLWYQTENDGGGGDTSEILWADFTSVRTGGKQRRVNLRGSAPLLPLTPTCLLPPNLCPSGDEGRWTL